MFSSELGGLRVAMDSLIGHLAYGLALGVLAGEPSERVFSLREEKTDTPSERLRRAA